MVPERVGLALAWKAGTALGLPLRMYQGLADLPLKPVAASLMKPDHRFMTDKRIIRDISLTMLGAAGVCSLALLAFAQPAQAARAERSDDPTTVTMLAKKRPGEPEPEPVYYAPPRQNSAVVISLPGDVGVRPLSVAQPAQAASLAGDNGPVILTEPLHGLAWTPFTPAGPTPPVLSSSVSFLVPDHGQTANGIPIIICGPPSPGGGRRLIDETRETWVAVRGGGGTGPMVHAECAR